MQAHVLSFSAHFQLNLTPEPSKAIGTDAVLKVFIIRDIEHLHNRTSIKVLEGGRILGALATLTAIEAVELAVGIVLVFFGIVEFAEWTVVSFKAATIEMAANSRE